MEMRVQTLVRECVGRNLVDAAGDKIGTIKAVYVDDQTSQPEWFAVGTGWFGNHLSFVPIHGTDVKGADVRSLYSKATVKDSPHVDADGHLTPEEQRDLFDYYRVNDVAPIRQPAGRPRPASEDMPDLDTRPLSTSDRLHNDRGDAPLTDRPLADDARAADHRGDRMEIDRNIDDGEHQG